MIQEQGFTELAPRPVGPYSQGCKSAGFVFVSGQGPLDPATGRICAPDIASQTRQVLTNIRHILTSMRATMKDVVKTTVIITDAKDFAAMNEVYKEFFAEPYPARTTFIGQLVIPGMLVEIDATAQTDKWHWE
ncbi:MAG: Rid family detoxifying hydrolase [Dehalococcoidia bacterium]|nr:Rid family detoxifying hydrolase [Dehalococcoidia bacterium]